MEDSMDDMNDIDSIEDVFKSAANYVRQIGSRIGAEKLLYFYARYKQVSDGLCTTPKPGLLDFQGRQKWDAWKKLGDMTKIQAMREYISFLDNTEPGWQSKFLRADDDISNDYQSKKSNQKSGMGIFVSTMQSADEELSDQQKTIFHWCQEGNVNKVKAMLNSAGHQINQLDSEGMGLLHWASDRGLEDMVTLLLEHGADVNLQDCDGQTAMHYAVSCEHENIVRVLVSWKADFKIRDSDGNSALEIASSDMKALFDSLGVIMG